MEQDELRNRYVQACFERDAMAERHARNPSQMTFMELGKAWDKVYETRDALKDRTAHESITD